jgi:hypothetical protein
MSPAWSLVGGGAFPQPLRLPAGGMMVNFQGDEGLSSSAGVVPGWADQSGLDQNIDTIGGTPGTGIYSIDGIPTVSFPIGWGVNGNYISRSSNMVRSDGVTPLDGSMPRTVMAMVLPIFGGVPGISVTGGPVLTFMQLSNWYTCMFELGPGPPTLPAWPTDGAYAWAGTWSPEAGGPSTPNNQFGPVVSSSGGLYDNVPTLVEWRNTGAADLEFRVNNVPTVVAPLTRGASGVSVFAGFLIGNSQPSTQSSFFGGIAAITAWDYNQATNPAAHEQAINFYRTKFPSAPIIPD